MKVSQHFDIREFVPEEIWRGFGVNSIWFLDPRMVTLAEFYRAYFDAPVTINNYLWGGILQNRGFRFPNVDIGSYLSQHKFGRAFDCNIKGISSDEVRNEILRNERVFMEQGLTSIEHGDYATSWAHNDIRHTGRSKILIVKPSKADTQVEYFENVGTQLLSLDPGEVEKVDLL